MWDQDLAHALPTLAVMFFLLAQRNFSKTTTSVFKTPWYWLQLIALGACSFLWYLFESLSISLPAYLLIVVILCLFISTSLSAKVMFATIPYLGLIIFTIPIWSELTTLLVELSSKMVGYAVKLSGLTALIDGSSIFLPSGTIYIADGCSGLRYLTIALLMGYLLILINQYNWQRAITTIVIATLLGLFANWLRIYLLVLIGYHTEMKSSMMQDHETFGWIVFTCILLPSIYFSPISKQIRPNIEIPLRPSWLASLLIMIGPALLLLSPAPITNHQPLNLKHLDNYIIHNQTPIGARLISDIPTREKRVVMIDGLNIQIDLFTHAPKSKREEVVPYIASMIDSAIWNKEKKVILDSQTGNFETEIYKRIGSTARIVVAKQYIVGRHYTDKYLNAKLLQIIAKASGDSYFGLLVSQVNCATNCEEEISTFASALKVISKPQE